MAKTFNVYGQTIAIDDNYERYNAIRQQFEQAAQESAQKLERLYDSYGSIKNVLNSIFDDGMKIINGVIDNLVINEFMQLKIYDIDTKTFCNYFCQQGYFVWDDGVEQVSAEYKKIFKRSQESERPLSDYRRSPDRPGLATKALKRATEAGVRNSVPGGVTHTLLSAMDTYVSDLYDPAKEERRIAAEARALKNADDQRLQELLEREIKSFYTSNNTKKILRSAMYRSVFAMQLSVWDVLREHKCAENLVFMSNAAMEKAEATINNFQRMPKEDVLEIFPEILLLAPYNRELYKAMWSLFEDPDGELAVLAKYFGIDASFIRSKTELIVDKLFSEINPELKKSEQSALEAKEKFSLALKSNGVEDTQVALEYLDAINSVLRDFDLKARTFDGVVFDTREEAQKAQTEKEKAQAEKEENKRIDKYLSGLNYENSETDAKEAMIKLQSYPITVKSVFDGYVNKIQDIINSFDIKARTIKFNNQAVVLETRERVKEFSELEKIYSAYTDENATSFPKVGLQKIFELLNKMPEEIKSFYFRKFK